MMKNKYLYTFFLLSIYAEKIHNYIHLLIWNKHDHTKKGLYK